MIHASVIPTCRPRRLPGLLLLAAAVAALAVACNQLHPAASQVAPGNSHALYSAGYQAGIETFSDVVGSAYSTGYRSGQQALCGHEAPL